ncbi:hydroxymethylbilane synthase [Streptomyces sp. DSM 110735]|uniref:hydroxymethylbilane synthase n=1 Tax=Streptomyces sp. DSM 110735 TaxID=2775031 RepID=UPI0018F646F3|nr:hydroxymethylbilane synthase [Streptomyces sp. DSM 110735]MBJ7902440.1 hydroxymethylbilane synthase [Streptomyces sp. DSM 110735]
MTQRIRIASRASAMATAQVTWLTGELGRIAPDVVAEFVPVSTLGDRWGGPLAEVGGKAVFTSAVTRAVLDGQADLALHCAKDMPGDSPEPEGLVCRYPRRDDVRDVLVDPGGRRLDELPTGTRVGTSAPRRIAQLAASHPHLELIPVRGNADTRLALARAGETVDAVVLAGAGLRRIGREVEATEVLDAYRMMPALGAGQLVMQVRETDEALLALLDPLVDADATRAAVAERTLLRALTGHCHAPIAGHAVVDASGQVRLAARVYAPDGSVVLGAEGVGGVPEEVSRAVAEDLVGQGADEVLASSRRT